jgi:hypothetical protein
MFHRESKDPIFGASQVLAHTIIRGIKIIIFSFKKTIQLGSFQDGYQNAEAIHSKNISQDFGVL